jgi:hypothetical protein
MKAVRDWIGDLAAVAPHYSPDAAKEKIRLLDLLAASHIRSPRDLLRFHETLCFLQAYPDDRRVLARVDPALEAFPARVHRLQAAARARLHDSGIAGTTLDYPFGLPMARWLVSRFPEDVEVAWGKYDRADELDEALALLITPVEEDAFSFGGLGWKGWLRAAKAGRRMSDLQLLLELLEGSDLAPPARDWMFEHLGLPIQVRLRRPGASRTLVKLPWSRPFFHRRGGLRRTGVNAGREAQRPLPPPRRAPRPLAESLIGAARVGMLTRFRELHAFSHANPEDVLVAEPGRGVQIALIGILPAFRFPLEGYYAFLALKNGVPVGYGGGCELFGVLDLATNIFPTFRQGESAWIFSQIARLYCQVWGSRTVVVDPYQIGHENEEAIRSGAFYFYHRLGFCPRDPEVLRLAGEEVAKIAQDRAYRSPAGVLRRLARAELYLILPGGHPAPERRLRSSQVAALVSQRIAQEYRGDRRAAVRGCADRVARALGVSGWRAWSGEGRRAFEQWSVVADLIPDLARWPAAERRRLVQVIRARGAGSELDFVRARNAHRRLRKSLEALTAAAGAAPNDK